MSESNLYSVKEIFSFWRKFEWFYNFSKKIFWTLFILNSLFWLIYIPIKDKNTTPILGLIICFIFFIISSLPKNDKISRIIFLSGVLIFIFSNFLILPFEVKEDGNLFCDFITNQEGKLINYGENYFFHIPIYDLHFNYELNPKREIKNNRDKTKLIITFRYDFNNFFKEKKKLNYLISRKYFDGIVDKKTALIKNYIEKNGNPEKFIDLKDLNDPWLKITSLEINFDPIKIE